MKLYLTLIIVCFFSVGYSQDFGCFSEPNSGDFDRIFCINRRQVNNDSLLWIQFKIPKINDGYYKEMWNKYQEKMEGNIVNGKRNGIWRIFLKDENIYYHVSFNDNKKEGEWKCFKVNGNDTLVQIKGFYKDDLKDGEFINYAKDTVIYEISNYKAGKLNGENIIYNFPRNNKKYLSIISEYRDGKLYGTEKEYKLDSKGKCYVYRISKYSNDGLSETSVVFSSEGDTLNIYKNTDGNFNLDIEQFRQIKIGKKLLVCYRNSNGLLENIDYSANGDTIRVEISDSDKYSGRIYIQDTLDRKWKIDKVMNYYNGLTDGSYKKYYSNGQLAYEIHFKKGLLCTAVNAFSKDGKKLYIGTLKDGNGTLNFYYPDGTLKSSFTYYNSTCKGNIVSYYKNGIVEIEGVMYSKKPSTIELSKYTDDDLNFNNLKNNLYGDIHCYHDDKTNISIIKYDTISRIESFKYFYNNGNPYLNCFEIKNKKIGIYSSFYENGNVEVNGFYKINKDSLSNKDSTWSYYYKEGNLRASINYKDGEKLGLSKYYDKTGKLRRLEIIENDGTHYSIFDGDTVNYTDKNGLKQGKWIGFPYSFMSEKEFCDDIPNQIEYYKNGKPTGIWEDNGSERFYTVGKKKYIWKDSTLAYCYVSNKKDQLQEEGEIIYPDLKFGLWKEYDNDKGYLKAEGQYYLDRKVGQWKIYRKNGKVKMIIDYNKRIK